MFKSARLKLTIWYLLIIMVITLSFSSFVYIGVNANTRRALEGQRHRLERQITRPEGFLPMGPMIDVETLIEIRKQTLTNLIMINTAIFFISGSLSYLLAGKTLRPIEDMVEKQKRFISDAAHEMKTPLTAMKTSLEVTLRDKKLDLDGAKDVLISTVEEVDKLSKFTASLLRKSKYQNGNSVSHDNVHLETLIKDICRKMSPIAEKKNNKINTNLESISVTGNKDELDELLTNLIDNAIKYNKKNSIINIELKSSGSMAVT
ncbi:MAG: HAMP domain-containing sensor histidine kinase, partial [Patescibacteria group bacterium]